MKETAALGFRSKTGRAIVVVLAGHHDDPKFVLRREVQLVDPSMTIGPYHEVMDLPWSEAQNAVQPVLAKIERIAAQVIEGLLGEIRERGFGVRAAGIVGSPDRDLARIGNPHIRAHAAEGIAFRRVLQIAASSCRLKVMTFSDRDITARAPVDLLKVLGRSAGPPWRADERAAATAAWIAL
jgi:hypothetical protein